METRAINPWKWQDQRNYVQAVEVKAVNGTLYCSGQTAIDADGKSSDADMATQLTQAIANLEHLITEADYDCKNIVRLNVYHTDINAFFDGFHILQDWVVKHGIRQATTVIEVKSLFETLKVELEATVVK
ncbi:RidA family protein [Pedobacter petrophilus]|uniref:RidA family protein n=1 Tax=Pedobacter petrophilus TaxID=1908241 RepID=A0A7K0FZ46_9SPHI|nr:RidA family protein [Pedobacter petrophilus]MRX76785.1 RidA family protein [Pedobacter petrophilus]